MKKINIITIILLVAILVASSIYFFINYNKQKREEQIFQNLISEITEGDYHSKDENSKIQNKQLENQKQHTYSPVNLKTLKEQNEDLKGYIQIDNTQINYPVMQNGMFYLYRNFYKNKSSLGIPFIASYCNIEKDKNLIIYGHNMKSGKMFADLIKYCDYNFYKNNKYIRFYTIKNNETIESIYEIVFAFKTTADEGKFKYYNYYALDTESEYQKFITNCRNYQLYNTETETEFKDCFITLSTCEYSLPNGRMVVIAKKVR